MDDPINAGGMINCALFLVFVFAGGMFIGDKVAMTLAILSAGTAVLTYGWVSMHPENHLTASVLNWVSVLLAVAGASALITAFYL